MKNTLLTALLLIIPSAYASRYDRPIAIFVSPTDAEIELAQATYTEEEYSVWLDDSAYYFYEIDNYLKSLGVETVSSSDMEFIFVANGKTTRFSLESRGYQWSVIMFNGVDDPRLFEFPYDPYAES